MAAAYVPLSFAPGEAYQFDWSYEVVLIGGTTVTVKVAHVRLCHSRMLFVRAYLANRPAGRQPLPRTGSRGRCLSVPRSARCLPLRCEAAPRRCFAGSRERWGWRGRWGFSGTRLHEAVANAGVGSWAEAPLRGGEGAKPLGAPRRRVGAGMMRSQASSGRPPRMWTGDEVFCGLHHEVSHLSPPHRGFDGLQRWTCLMPPNFCYDRFQHIAVPRFLGAHLIQRHA